MKRILLFICTNLAIVLVLGIVLNILTQVFGLNFSGYGGLLIFAALFGFGGAFISLWMSKWMAKRAYGVKVIEQPQTQTEQWILQTIERLARQADVKMPEVGIYDAPDMNAFATGASKNSSLIAVSSGLLQQMDNDEAEAVLAHEMSHIANGDMVTLTLIQGVVNTFVIFLARVIANLISNLTRSDEEGEGLGTFAYFGVVIALELILGILASTIVMWFSRQREFHADAGAADLVGARKMIAALERLRSSSPSHLQGEMMAFGIIGGKASDLFLSHPPLEKRIAALQNRD